MKSSETFGDLRKPPGTFGNLRKPSETVGNLRKPSETFKNLQNPSETFKTFKNLCKPSKPSETFKNLQKPSETFENLRKLAPPPPNCPPPPIWSHLSFGGWFRIVNIRLASTLGPESRASEPQRHQTPYIRAKFACRAYLPPTHEDPHWPPVIDIHAGLKNSLKRIWSIGKTIGLQKYEKN